MRDQTRRTFLTIAVGSLSVGGLGIVAGSEAGGAAEPTLGVRMLVGDEDGLFVPPSDPGGEPPEFDVTSFKVTGNGHVLHHELPIGSGKPYVLHHEGDGRYKPRGAVVNFQGPDALWPSEGRWRAVIREDVQAIEGPAFLWSVTRVDFFSRPRMQFAGSVVLGIWNDDLTDVGAIEDLVEEYTKKEAANPGGQ